MNDFLPPRRRRSTLEDLGSLRCASSDDAASWRTACVVTVRLPSPRRSALRGARTLDPAASHSFVGAVGSTRAPSSDRVRAREPARINRTASTTIEDVRPFRQGAPHVTRTGSVTSAPRVRVPPAERARSCARGCGFLARKNAHPRGGCGRSGYPRRAAEPQDWSASRTSARLSSASARAYASSSTSASSTVRTSAAERTAASTIARL